MKKTVICAILGMTAVGGYAQIGFNLDTYAGAQIATKDLNGTARYVGMGGAMEALGADISTMSTNPAGIGLFRKSSVSTSFGLNVQQDGKSFHDGSKVNASFDQIGIVLATQMTPTSYVNFGFNFHKSRNFDFVLSAADLAYNGSSLHRQTYVKALRGDLDTDKNKNLVHPYRESQIDQLNYRIIDRYDPKDKTKYVESISPRGIDYMFDRSHTGYIGEYDFNISGNVNNRVYWGVTLGIHDVHYNAYSEYSENLEPDPKYPDIKYAKYTDDTQITGTGYDVKAGVIVRPMEESPFRFGISVATPTWYSLRSINHTTIGDQYGVVDNIKDDIEFRLDTPWLFGASVGTTIGREWALGASYEFADYTSLDLRAITSRNYNYWNDSYVNRSKTDHEMKKLTNRNLRGVHTLKCGVEFRADEMISLRLGYNYVSPMYEKSAVRDQTIDSPGVYMASTSDYTNWNDTHRLTAGVGFTFDKFRLDLAYQYSATNGLFYPYMSSLTGSNVDKDGKPFTMTNECHGVDVSNKRHQLLCTLNYTF